MVPALALLLTLIPQDATRKVVVMRGGDPAIAGASQYKNWNITDTVLDSAQSAQALGGDGTLVVGPGKVMLIRFADLDRIVRPNERIKKATLWFVVDSPNSAIFEKAAVLLRPWGEGAVRTFGRMVKSNPTETAEKGGATWTSPFAGTGQNWDKAGAQGAGDAKPLTGISAEPGLRMEKIAVLGINGLEAALQAQANSPSTNFGYALKF